MGYPIRAALTANPLTKPLLDGTVRIPGFDWTAEVLDPAELFLRQLHGDEFDVFEMSLSTHLRVCSLRQDRWIALPVFTSRKLAHLAILVTERSGISGPSELRGRRIGVPEYQQTSAVWSRGVLEHDFCVRPSEIDWVMERGAERSHGAATEFVPPPGVRISPVDENESLGSLLMAGRIDGALRYIGKRNLVDLVAEPHARRTRGTAALRPGGGAGAAARAAAPRQPLRRGPPETRRRRARDPAGGDGGVLGSPEAVGRRQPGGDALRVCRERGDAPGARGLRLRAGHHGRADRSARRLRRPAGSGRR